MDAIDFYRRALSALESLFQRLAKRLGPAMRVRHGDSFVYRFQPESIECAIVQKLARLVSGLHACTALLQLGLVQEMGALQRVLDELGEDIFFLCQPLVGGQRLPIHDEYLRAFFREEFPDGKAYLSDDRAPQVSRRKIRAAIAAVMGRELNPSDALKLLQRLGGAYGGFVHGASPHIMDMYAGDPPRFHVSGMLGTERMPGHFRDLANHFHRAINSTMLVALSLKDEEASAQAYALRGEIEQQFPGLVRLDAEGVARSIASYRTRPMHEKE